LGSPNEFRKNYENPILRGRDADASEKKRQISDQKLQELSGIVSKFIIRRTNDILSKYRKSQSHCVSPKRCAYAHFILLVPTKYEHVVFCKLSPLQTTLYQHFISSKSIQKLLRCTGSQPLKAITVLKKLCNHPDLLELPADLEGCEELLPANYTPKARGWSVHPEFSGKMMVLDRVLAKIRKETNDKIVLISNYTQTLDIFEKLCREKQYGLPRATA
jgi:DNA repair and recombination protein RAD54 and RAD54-like protein